MPQEVIHIANVVDGLGAKVMVKLSPAVTRKLFDLPSRKISEIFSKTAESHKHRVSPSQVRIWRTRNKSRIPLWVLCELGRRRGWSLDHLEKEIIAISFKKGQEILAPNLPIVIDPVFDSILVHFYGDGNPSNCRFTQLNKERRKLFARKVEHVFGRLLSKKTDYGVNLPKLVFELYRWKYKIDFQKRRVPDQIYRKNWKHKLACIEAFLLDEGTIDSNSISLRNTDPLFLSDIRRLCTAIGYKCSKISKMGHRVNKEVLGFYILSESVPHLYKDVTALEKESPVLHLGVKQLHLKHLVEILTSHGKRYSLNRLILSALERNPRTISQLSLVVKARHSVVLKAIKRLECRGIVYCIGKCGRAMVWGPSNFYKYLSAKQKWIIDLPENSRRILMYLVRNGPATRRTLANELYIDCSNLYKNLNPLMQKKLIVKRFDNSGAAWYSSLIDLSEVLSVTLPKNGGGDC